MMLRRFLNDLKRKSLTVDQNKHNEFIKQVRFIINHINKDLKWLKSKLMMKLLLTAVINK